MQKYYKVFQLDPTTNQLLAMDKAVYEPNTVYDTGADLDKLALCTNTVYHFCKDIEDTWYHFDYRPDCAFAEVEVLGELLENTYTNFDIYASNKIRFRRLSWLEVINLTKDGSRLNTFAKQKLQKSLKNAPHFSKGVN